MERIVGFDLNVCSDSKKSESVEVGKCVFLISKVYFISYIKDYDLGRRLYFEYVDLFAIRIAYTLLTAFGRMKIQDVEITAVDFHNYIDDYTQKQYDQYIIIDVDSHISGWIDLDYSNGYKVNYKGMPFISMESVGRYGLLTDLESYDAFKESLVIVKREAFPCLMNMTDDGNTKFDYIDESSKEKGNLSLRVGVDIQKKMVYNASDKIVRVKMKKIKV